MSAAESIEVNPDAFDLRPEAGEANGAAALCLHGLTGTPYEVRPVAEALFARGVRARGPWMAGHDKGVEELAIYLVNEIQEVYRLQGVKINDKHIEVIVRQMLQKMEVEDGGGTTLLRGEQVDLIELEEANKKAIERDGKPARGRPEKVPTLLGS